MKARPRILFVIKDLKQGGTEGQLLRLLRAAIARDFEVRLCTFSEDVHYDELPVVIHHLNRPVRGWTTAGVIAKVIDDFRPDLVHSFRDRVNAAVRVALTRSRHQPAWLMSVRGRPILPVDLLLAALISPRAYRVTVNSVGIAESLQRHAYIPAERVALIHNLLDANAFAPATASARARARAELALADDAFVWVLPARISWVKNHFGLVLALRHLRRSGRLPAQATVLLAGRVRDRLCGWLLPRWARLWGVAQHLRWLGPVRDMHQVYAAADALVLPSWAEGMPNVSIEAHLSGLPAVVSRQANRDAIVEHRVTGLETATGDHTALAETMAAVMALPPEERAAMGARGRARVVERFRPEAVLDKLFSLYQAAISAQLARQTVAKLPVRNA